MTSGLLEMELSLYWGCDWKFVLIMRWKSVSLSFLNLKLQTGFFCALYLTLIKKHAFIFCSKILLYPELILKKIAE